LFFLPSTGVAATTSNNAATSERFISLIWNTIENIPTLFYSIDT
jgi:hypothetical protein